jgi:KipI family sensor histidine kinase inhibitor
VALSILVGQAMGAGGFPRILPCGDSAVTVEFGRDVDPVVNARVLAFDARIREGVPGVVETIPTYRSLLVHYDPVPVDFQVLAEALLALARDLPEAVSAGRVWRIPVVYGGEFGRDLEDTAALHGITTAELIQRHSAPVYRVYMSGFLPGFAYLGGLDPAIATPRLETPRSRTPAGSISIGGVQALIASIEAPSGWRLLGRTPVRNFMLGRDPVFILEAGDGVVFDPISPSRWASLDRAAEAGELVAEAVA